jgi:hypothetical protein
VRLEADHGEEIRYRVVNVAGQTYRAPRVLPRIAFLEAFHAAGDGYHMRVQVVDATDEAVSYARVDANGSPVAPPRTVSVAGFLASFRSESATY